MKATCIFIIGLTFLELGRFFISCEIANDQRPIRHQSCPKVDDANHPVLLRHEDCTKYYSCRNGLAYPLICPNNLHWSTLTYRCDYPEVAKCVTLPIIPDQLAPIAVKPAPSVPSVPSVPVQTLPVQPVPVQSVPVQSVPVQSVPVQSVPVQSIPVGSVPVQSIPVESVPMQPISLETVYERHPDECHKFYQKTLMDCGPNYAWNVQLQRCDLPHLAQCQVSSYQVPNNVEPVTTISPLPTAATPPPGSWPVDHYKTSQDRVVQNNLDNQQIENTKLNKLCTGSEFLHYPDNCHKFIRCSNTIAFTFDCPSGLFWNSKLLTCDNKCV